MKFIYVFLLGLTFSLSSQAETSTSTYQKLRDDALQKLAGLKSRSDVSYQSCQKNAQARAEFTASVEKAIQDKVQSELLNVSAKHIKALNTYCSFVEELRKTLKVEAISIKNTPQEFTLEQLFNEISKNNDEVFASYGQKTLDFLLKLNNSEVIYSSLSSYGAGSMAHTVSRVWGTYENDSFFASNSVDKGDADINFKLFAAFELFRSVDTMYTKAAVIESALSISSLVLEDQQ